MDSSQVSFVSLTLDEKGFDTFACDRNVSLSMFSVELEKILKCANNDDILTMKAQANADTITFSIESLMCQEKV